MFHVAMYSVQGTHKSLKHNTNAKATVGAIIDGMGSLGESYSSDRGHMQMYMYIQVTSMHVHVHVHWVHTMYIQCTCIHAYRL